MISHYYGRVEYLWVRIRVKAKADIMVGVHPARMKKQMK